MRVDVASARGVEYPLLRFRVEWLTTTQRGGHPMTGHATRSRSLSFLSILLGAIAIKQVTQGGSGRFASETTDGHSLVYQPKDSDAPLLVKPLAGGPARQLLACVKQTAFGVGLQGVYYAPAIDGRSAAPCDRSEDGPRPPTWNPRAV